MTNERKDTAAINSFSFVVEQADLERELVQYSWVDGSEFVFMNSTTYDVCQNDEKI